VAGQDGAAGQDRAAGQDGAAGQDDQLATAGLDGADRSVAQEHDFQGRGGVVAGSARRGMFGAAGSGDTSGYGGLRLPAYAPLAAHRPFGSWFDELTDDLLAALDERGIARGAVQQVVVDRGEITYYLQPDQVRDVCQALRDGGSLRFELCSSVSGVDYGAAVPQRLHVVYHLTSMTYRRRIRLEVALDVPGDGGMDEYPHLPSVASVYPTADWQERETWDMFGIVFDGHPALTRILMPDDWAGHPQRKDYPLGGIPVEYKGAEIPPPDQRRAYS